jgi:hypothetical protein
VNVNGMWGVVTSGLKGVIYVFGGFSERGKGSVGRFEENGSFRRGGMVGRGARLFLLLSKVVEEWE